MEINKTIDEKGVNEKQRESLREEELRKTLLE
ncbi:hypothetical protein SAMN05216353_1369 [Halobacillus alkaliphilus]|uniref:Uncharacterized protein n=1 Tax=Halobacillus alkaliphilus TaxID=396056 RepID=A0A1I2QZM7_9BACI|nr:hypothetical protein SAMN05216353_1369 [Halobacillus alkaliphilus]